MLRAVDDGHITTIAVDPAWQRRGIASRLWWPSPPGPPPPGACHNLTLEVRVTNHGAQTLYRRFGFVPAGMRKAYYPDNGEDAMVMWATDIDAPDYRRPPGHHREPTSTASTVIEGDWI